MPLGLCNTPATFQRPMEKAMGELYLKDSLIYLDDIIIFSEFFDQHMESRSCRQETTWVQSQIESIKVRCFQGWSDVSRAHSLWRWYQDRPRQDKGAEGLACTEKHQERPKISVFRRVLQTICKKVLLPLAGL